MLRRSLSICEILVSHYNGNIIERVNTLTNARRRLDWDDEDRLTHVQEQGKHTQFVYDAGGTRTHKDGAFGTTAYPNAFLSVKNSGEVTKHYLRGVRGACPSPVHSGQRVSSAVNTEGAPAASDRVYWLHSNHLGGVNYVTDRAGAVHEHTRQRRTRRPVGQ